MKDIIYFFRHKIKEQGIPGIIRGFFEENYTFLFKYWPDPLGMVIRYLAYKWSFKKAPYFFYISSDVDFSGMNEIEIGKRFTVNKKCHIYARGGVSIGDYVTIGPYVAIFASSHKAKESAILIQESGRSYEKVTIEDNVWIGSHVVILPGVTVAEGCVIGAHSVLTKSTEKFGIYGGVPAKLIGKRQ